MCFRSHGPPWTMGRTGPRIGSVAHECSKPSNEECSLAQISVSSYGFYIGIALWEVMTIQDKAIILAKGPFINYDLGRVGKLGGRVFIF